MVQTEAGIEVIQLQGSLRHDLSKLRAKGLVVRLPNSRRYRLLPQGYPVCLLFLKLFERAYAPLTAGLLSPVSADSRLRRQKQSQLDRLHRRVVDDPPALLDALDLVHGIRLLQQGRGGGRNVRPWTMSRPTARRQVQAVMDAAAIGDEEHDIASRMW